MATRTLPDRKSSSAAPSARLTPEQLVAAYRNMLLSRRLDDKEVQLKRQNKIFFQISGAGHDAVLTAAGMTLKPAYDWFYTYYRDRALCLELGVTPAEMLYEAVGAAADPASGGRQMPSHWGHKAYNIVSASSPTGTQFLQGVGCAEATLRANLLETTEGFQRDEVVLISTGEGQTSEGEFWESLNTASNLKLPAIYRVEDNGYAISVPVEVNTAGGNISKLVRSFPNLFVEEVDGCDLLSSYDTMQRAVDYARQRKGPALVHAHVIRPYSHSLSDDEKLYRPDVERQRDAARDPISRMQMFLIREGILDEKGINRLEKDVDDGLQAAVDQVMAAPLPQPETIKQYLYSPDLDPSSPAFDTQVAVAEHSTQEKNPAPKTMADLINATLRDEMKRDERVVIFGEDVADCSRDEYLKQKMVKGKGGVFKLTAGLQCDFGSERVFNSPIAEASIVGRAVGLAVRCQK